jgi:NTE family protein
VATTAFVLSGGGSLGAVQVGMLLALAEQRIAPDILIGTSVGAVNAGWIAGGATLTDIESLADIWAAIRRQDVFPTAPVRGLLGLLGHRDHLVPAESFRTLLERHLKFKDLADATIAVRVVTTDLLTGQEILLGDGNAIDAIAASAAIPGVFPSVESHGRILVDGGASNNVPISHAIDLGATTVYVLPTGYACALTTPPRGALATALQALTLVLQQRLATDVVRYTGSVDLHVVPPLCPLTISPLDFTHTAELISRARDSTRSWLEHPAADFSILSPHRHK